MNYVRTNELIYEILTTVSELLECLSVDRFEPVSDVDQLRRRAYELNQQRIFLAALNFENVGGEHITYRLHMDTDNTQPTFENKNRFWFPGPAASMLVDLKYHRGFVQLKQIVDLGIIKHKRQELGPVEEPESDRPTRPVISLQRVDDDEDLFNDEDDVDPNMASSDKPEDSHTTIFPQTLEVEATTVGEQQQETTTEQETTQEGNRATLSTNNPDFVFLSNGDVKERSERVRRQQLSDLTSSSDQQEEELNGPVVNGHRVKRQGLLDLLSSFGSDSESKDVKFAVDDMQFYTKQFPYPAYVSDE